jgi:hypothetical protein
MHQGKGSPSLYGQKYTSPIQFVPERIGFQTFNDCLEAAVIGIVEPFSPNFCGAYPASCRSPATQQPVYLPPNDYYPAPFLTEMGDIPAANVIQSLELAQFHSLYLDHLTFQSR